MCKAEKQRHLLSKMLAAAGQYGKLRKLVQKRGKSNKWLCQCVQGSWSSEGVLSLGRWSGSRAQHGRGPGGDGAGM